MVKENKSQEFRLKNMHETRNYFIKEINQNDIMSKSHNNFRTNLNYIAYTVFNSLLGISIGITSSIIGLKIYEINAGIKKHR